MTVDLLAASRKLITADQVTRIAAMLGESEGAVSTGLSAAFGMILAALLGRTIDAEGMNQVMELLTDHASKPAILGNVDRLLARDPSSSAITDLGGTFISIVFGQGLAAATTGLSEHAAIPRAAASALLAFAAPVTMATVGDCVRRGCLSARGLAVLLGGQREAILNAAPPMLRNTLASDSLRAIGSTAAPPRAASSFRSARPMLAALALLIGVWAMMRDRRAPEMTAPDASVGPVGTGGPEAVQGATAADAATTMASGTAAFLTRRLPSKVNLTIPASGVEASVIAFIEDPTRPTEPAVWFNFDRVSFEIGSTTLSPESTQELKNTAEILKAYPDVRVKIGAYTDNSGNAAASLQLSQARATKVAKTIVGLGVAPDRLSAEGYGDRDPVADNSTEEGRARNRRIAIRVTQK